MGLIYRNCDYSEFYEISNTGKLRNSRNKKEVKLHTSKKGYITYCGTLGRVGKYICFKIHKCVAETFIINPEDKEFVNHIDGNKQNNIVENLEWCTNQENMRHAWDTGLMKIEDMFGNSNKKFKLTMREIEYIRKNYIPRDKKFGSRALGRMFGVDHVTILWILKENSYILSSNNFNKEEKDGRSSCGQV